MYARRRPENAMSGIIDLRSKRAKSRHYSAKGKMGRSNSGATRRCTISIMTSPRIREAVFDDYDQLDALERRFGLKSKPFEEWRHLWTGNPLYRHIEGWPIGWVIEDENRRIAGHVGNIPLLYEFQGREIVAASARAWVAEDRYRVYSTFLLDNFFSQGCVGVYLNTTVNGHAADAFGTFGSLRVPVGEWGSAGFWVVDHRGFAECAMRLKVGALANVLAPPISVALRLWDNGGALGHDEGETVRPCAAFDARFDNFWTALRSYRSRKLLAVRNCAMLNWHFHAALARNEAWIATVEDVSGIRAYAVFIRRDMPEIGLKRVRLADFQALEGGEALLDALLGWAYRRCRDEGVHVLEIMGEGKRAPFHRKLPAWCYFYQAADQELREALKNPKAWMPSAFDGDASL